MLAFIWSFGLTFLDGLEKSAQQSTAPKIVKFLFCFVFFFDTVFLFVTVLNVLELSL